MNPQGLPMTVIPPASVSAHAEVRLISRSSVAQPQRPTSPETMADWFIAEDDYFPFDADSFEER
jgi:hypothetical protein